MARPYVWQQHQSGATDGQVVTWDNALMQWVPADPSGGTLALDDLTDVDTTTTPPADGDVLTFDSASGLWLPAAPAGGGGGGGLTHTVYGYNTVGASQETTGGVKMKKITLAAAGLLTAIEFHVKGNAANVQSFGAALYGDSAGTPTEVIGIGMMPPGSTNAAINATGRWMAAAIGKYLTAGDYWLAVYVGGNQPTIYYDTTGGTDKTYSPSGGWYHDGSMTTVTTTTKRYSIRASVLS